MAQLVCVTETLKPIIFEAIFFL